MRLTLLAVCVLLSGCAVTDNLATYDARIESGGQVVKVHNKHGSLLILEQPDGTKITADDRGHPAEPGIISKLAEFATVQAARGVAK